MKAWAVAAAILPGLGAAAPAQHYVPASGWSRDDQAEFFEDWFGGQLQAMEEPALSAPGGNAGFRRRFRMLVLPSFHHAYAVRLDERIDGSAEVRVVRLDGAGGYSPGKLLEQESYSPDRHAVRRLHRAIAKVGLATLPRETDETRMGDGGSIVVCADGVRFVFELVDERGSRLVTRGCEMDRRLWKLVDAADALRRTVGSDLARYR
jgi:hypothetical protein